MPRPVLLPRAVRAGVLTLTALGTAVVGAPAASAMVVPGDAPQQHADASATTHLLDNSPVSFLGTPTEPVSIGTGTLHLFVAEEQGNELGGPVDLGGATVRVTFTSQSSTGGAVDESYTCTTDHDGACVFADADGEFELSPFPGDVVTVEQLTAPTSGVFALPSAEDRVVHAAVPASAPGGDEERVDPADDVIRMAPDVLGKRDWWTQIQFFAPLAIVPDPGSEGTAPGLPAPNPVVPGTSTGSGIPAGGDSAPAGTEGGATTTSGSSTGSVAGAAESSSSTSQAGPSPVGTSADGAAQGAQPAAAGLATTGAELGPVLGLAGLLLLTGGGALVAVRRRALR